MLTTLLVVSALSVSAHTDHPLDVTEDGIDDSEPIGNGTEALGELLGGPCEDDCKHTLTHVSCSKKTQICECDPGYPVRLGVEKGCAKPASLGEQCFHYQSCVFFDQNADCVQISHNAICQCKEGFHLATVQKPQKRVFCTQDLVVIATNLSTLLGVASGLAIFTALICFVLKLFSGSRPRHYANTNLAPPIIFAQSACHQFRSPHPISIQTDPKGHSFVITSEHKFLRQQHAKTSVHSSTSSTKSFSARQYERERENRLLAKARERERGDGGSTSPRSLENLIDGPLPSESWPRLDEVKGKAFSPDMLDDPPDIPFPDIDQMDGFENPFSTGLDPIGTQVIQTHGIENPLGSLVNPEMRIGEPVRKPALKRLDPLGQQSFRNGDQRLQQSMRVRDPLGQQPLRISGPPLMQQSMRIPDQPLRIVDPLGGQHAGQLDHQVLGRGIENPLASRPDPLNAT